MHYAFSGECVPPREGCHVCAGADGRRALPNERVLRVALLEQGGAGAAPWPHGGADRIVAPAHVR